MDHLISELVLYSAMSGAAGGVVSFSYGYLHDNYNNNRYRIKLFVEIVGATVTATFLTHLVTNVDYKIIASFCVGLTWSQIIQTIRVKTTSTVEAEINNRIGRSGNE